MSVISIEDIENSTNKTVNCKFEEKIDGIDSVGPVCADLELKSLGDFIEVKGHVECILKLECDLCLKEFEYKLDFDVDEMYAKYALQEEYAQETEIKEGQFITDLNGEDKIDIYDLLYQSVILNIPNKKVCGINCNGNKFLKEEDLSDPRMEIFKNIQIDK